MNKQIAAAIVLIDETVNVLMQAGDKRLDPVINRLQATTMTLTLLELGVQHASSI